MMVFLHLVQLILKLVNTILIPLRALFGVLSLGLPIFNIFMYPIMVLKSYEYLNFMRICELKIYRGISVGFFTYHLTKTFSLLLDHEDVSKEFGLNLPCSPIAHSLMARLDRFLGEQKTQLADELLS